MPTFYAQTPIIPASRWRRFACMLYEGVLLFAVVFLAGYLFDTLTQSRSGLTLRTSRQIFLFVVIGFYFVSCWRLGGQTLPMKTWNVKLLNSKGNTPNTSRLIARYLLLWPIPLIFMALLKGLSFMLNEAAVDWLLIFAPFTVFIWSWFDPNKQFLHDRLLQTALVMVPKHQAPSSKNPK